MKTIIRSVCGILAVLSLLFFLYGSIKFSRLDKAPSLPSIEIDVPGAVVQSLSSSQKDKESVQVIVGISLISLVVSTTGFLISSKSDAEEPQ